MSRVGVLALQGDFDCHRRLLESLGVEGRRVLTADGLRGLDGLIIPGGESTTIGMLMDRWGLREPVRQCALQGMPLLGTCAGAILLARRIKVEGHDGSRPHEQPGLGLLDIGIVRNAYGRQIESFEAELECRPELCGDDRPLSGIFIRAPIIEYTGEQVAVLASFEGRPVVVRQANLLVATFHPELVGEPRVHSYFLKMVADR